jgi:hypothetical protein
VRSDNRGDGIATTFAGFIALALGHEVTLFAAGGSDTRGSAGAGKGSYFLESSLPGRSGT